MAEGTPSSEALALEPDSDPEGTLRTLCGIGAPSGHEDVLTRGLYNWLVRRDLTVVADRLGQIAVTFDGGHSAGPTVLITAHLDQLGLVVTKVEDDGFVRVERLGGVPERVLPGLGIRVHGRDGEVSAVVGLKAHHLTPADEKYEALPASALYLDLGVSNAAEVASLGVRVGDACTYQFGWHRLAGERIATTSLDDRIGVTALVALIERLRRSSARPSVCIAFTTQEEFHVRGGLALISRLRPDVHINVDVCPASDPPDLNLATGARLGAGPVLSRYSFHGRGTLGGLIPHPAVLAAAEQSAAAVGPYQMSATIGVITDAAFGPMATPEGVASIDIGVATRYTHSPVETADMADVSALVDVLDDLVRRLPSVNLARI